MRTPPRAANNYLYRRVTPVGLYNEAAVLPVARPKLGIFLVFKAKKKSRWGSGWKIKWSEYHARLSLAYSGETGK
ncbi:hypothetical protein [Klebsiella quasipneumoniae]|uniref:hypothetical protein n=1 Tax=Klebsiella quasipneumoniae TaxID=1463165 RepID=UPI0010338627|nr:hypothetical protein [Klebsiella quasipneumoniae]